MRRSIGIVLLGMLCAATTTAEDTAFLTKGTCGTEVMAVCSRPLTLEACYFRALKQSELIAIEADRIRETDARLLQALSIMLPHISFLSYDSQEEKVTQGGVGLSGLTPSKSSSRMFNAKQTLFSGFKAFAALKATGQEKKQFTMQKERAEQLLLVDVANAFYLLMEIREDIKARAKIRKALADRVTELRSREQLGRSKPSEVVNAKAQFYSVEADIEVVMSQEIVARQILEFLIGGPAGAIEDTRDLPPALMPEGYYVALSESRPDVQSSKFGWEYSRSAARVVDSGFLPTVDVEGNYYTQRTAFDKGVDWDVTLSVDVPIFDGGFTLGKSKEAWLKADEARLEYSRVRRKAPYDIKDAFVRLKSAMAVHEARHKQYATAKLNYYLQQKDYLRSLVSNLDVLASIQTLQDSQRSYIHALYEAKRQYWQLQVAIGRGITETPHDAF